MTELKLNLNLKGFIHVPETLRPFCDLLDNVSRGTTILFGGAVRGTIFGETFAPKDFDFQVLDLHFDVTQFLTTVVTTLGGYGFVVHHKVMFYFYQGFEINVAKIGTKFQKRLCCIPGTENIRDFYYDATPERAFLQPFGLSLADSFFFELEIYFLYKLMVQKGIQIEADRASKSLFFQKVIHAYQTKGIKLLSLVDYSQELHLREFETQFFGVPCYPTYFPVTVSSPPCLVVFQNTFPTNERQVQDWFTGYTPVLYLYNDIQQQRPYPWNILLFLSCHIKHCSIVPFMLYYWIPSRFPMIPSTRCHLYSLSSDPSLFLSPCPQLNGTPFFFSEPLRFLYQNILFLDINGVLSDDRHTLDQTKIDLLRPLLEISSLRIVLSSTWRLDPLKRQQVHDELGIQEYTPDLSAFFPDQDKKNVRCAEIKAFLNDTISFVKWVAVDNTQLGDPGSLHIQHIDGMIGITNDDVQSILIKLDQQVCLPSSIIDPISKDVECTHSRKPLWKDIVDPVEGIPQEWITHVFRPFYETTGFFHAQYHDVSHPPLHLLQRLKPFLFMNTDRVSMKYVRDLGMMYDVEIETDN